MGTPLSCVVCGDFKEFREDREVKEFKVGSEREFIVRVVQMCAKKPPMGST